MQMIMEPIIIKVMANIFWIKYFLDNDSLKYFGANSAITIPIIKTNRGWKLLTVITKAIGANREAKARSKSADRTTVSLKILRDKTENLFILNTRRNCSR